MSQGGGGSRARARRVIARGNLAALNEIISNEVINEHHRHR